jgi:hypothetical protein
MENVQNCDSYPVLIYSCHKFIDNINLLGS